MSNAPKPAAGGYSLDRYRADAEKKADKSGDFVLHVDTDRTISIPRPSGEQMFEAEEAMRDGSSKDVMYALCGNQAGEIIDLLGPEDAAVLHSFGRDLQKHFGIGQ